MNDAAITAKPAGTASRRLGLVLGVTLLVAGCPVAAVWWLREAGVLSAPLAGLGVGMALSLAASYVGRRIWERRPGSEDLLFSELMIWGYLHRLRTQRRLASAAALLGAGDAPNGVAASPGRDRVKLLEQLVSGIESRDPYLHGHSRRVARHAWMIARRMALPREEVARIRTAAAIHDVGKIKTPKEILHKPAALNDEEYALIKQHPGDGAQMAAALEDEALASMVRHHHERIDGSGYPDGLAGEEIPLGARIIAVADTFDAITSIRPYRGASPHKRAIDILRAEAGTRLDPEVVKAFTGHYAGRRPLAIWAFIAALPERFLSWIGGSFASVAAAAKVVAVAALVGGAAATGSVLSVPASADRQGTRHGSTAQSSGQTSADVSLARGPSAGTPRKGTGVRVRVRSRHVGALRSGPSTGSTSAGILVAPGATPVAGSAPSSAGGGSTASGGAKGSGRREEIVAGEGGKAKSEGSGTSGGGEESQEQKGKGEKKKGKSEEKKGKSEEAHGQKEETTATEETSSKDKSEEAHAQKEEAVASEEGSANGNGQEAHGKSEEPSGKEKKGKEKSEAG